jgi:hypothetical protein
MSIDYYFSRGPRLTDCFSSLFQKDEDPILGVFGYLHYEATTKSFGYLFP